MKASVAFQDMSRPNGQDLVMTTEIHEIERAVFIITTESLLKRARDTNRLANATVIEYLPEIALLLEMVHQKTKLYGNDLFKPRSALESLQAACDKNYLAAWGLFTNFDAGRRYALVVDALLAVFKLAEKHPYPTVVLDPALELQAAA